MLTREQVAGDYKTICECCESITVQEHVEELLAHDAEQRQTIDAQAQRIKELERINFDYEVGKHTMEEHIRKLEAALERHQEEP